MTYSAARINRLAHALRARRYLEIGVNHGDTFRHVAIEDRTGVDPEFRFDTSSLANARTRLVPATSDAFFAGLDLDEIYDIVFIDGLHRFEQVVRDFANVLLHTHRRSVIVLDDTVPSDVYSTLPSQSQALHQRKLGGTNEGSWHGDVYKTVFYIHDFWPGLQYRTVIDGGNPQTLVWRARSGGRTPLFNDLEDISRLDYFGFLAHLDTLKRCTQAEAEALCLRDLGAIPVPG